MEANRREVNPSGQELIEGSTIAGEISSVNHTAPSPSAPPIEGRVQLSDDQRRESKREADKRYNEKRKRKEDEMREELEKLEEYYGKSELESRDLEIVRDGMEARVDEENNIILSQLEDNYAGQNTEVQKINFTGETSTGQDGLKQEMNPAPITSNTILGENASMNLQTLPRSAQPAGSSGLPDGKRARKRISDKKHREKRKWTINKTAARIKELKEKNVKLESDKAVLKAEANQLRKQFDQLRNTRKKMAFKDARRNAKLEKVLDCMWTKANQLRKQLRNIMAFKDASRDAKLEKVLEGCMWTKANQLRLRNIMAFKDARRNAKLEKQKNHDELKNSLAYLSGKKKRKIEDTERQLEETRSANDLAQKRELIRRRLKQEIERRRQNATWNTVERRTLSNGGLAQGGDLLGSHGLYNTSPPRAAMASGSSPMQGSLAPGRPLSFEVTGFDTGETGLPVHHPPANQCGTTMGSGGLAVEDSPGLPQSELSQEWMHLPSSGIGDQENTSFTENLSMPSTPILENVSLPSTSFLENVSLPSTSFLENLPMVSTSFSDNDWIEEQYNAPTRMP